jgi:Flp pilus assembly protein TadG
MHRLQRLRTDESGNVLITFALMLPVLVAAVGAAVSYSLGSSVRTELQNSLDAAVLAAASSSDFADPAAAVATADEFFRHQASRYAAASATGATFKVEGLMIFGEGTGSVSNPFGRLLGSAQYPVLARSAATKEVVPVCMLGLNSTDAGSFDMRGHARLSAPNCAVQANSSNRTAMTQEGKPTAVAKKFAVTGGHKGDNFSPPPADGSSRLPDPYTAVPFPNAGFCPGGGSAMKIDADATLSPGTFCGGIQITGNTKVVLLPGIFIMEDGPFSIDGSSSVVGDRVMIAFTGPRATLQMRGSSSVKLTSPTSGPYTNIQFMQNRDDPGSRGLRASVGGSARLDYDGTAYFPTQTFWVFGDAGVNANSPGMAAIADEVRIQGNAAVTVSTANPRNLAVTTATTAYGARLIK